MNEAIVFTEELTSSFVTGHGVQRWITSVAIDGGPFIFKEFWPDLNSKLFDQK
jgi:hypothetical protein